MLRDRSVFSLPLSQAIRLDGYSFPNQGYIVPRAHLCAVFELWTSDDCRNAMPIYQNLSMRIPHGSREAVVLHSSSSRVSIVALPRTQHGFIDMPERYGTTYTPTSHRLYAFSHQHSRINGIYCNPTLNRPRISTPRVI